MEGVWSDKQQAGPLRGRKGSSRHIKGPHSNLADSWLKHVPGPSMAFGRLDLERDAFMSN